MVETTTTKYDKLGIARHLKHGLENGVVDFDSQDKYRIVLPDEGYTWYSKDLLRKIKGNFYLPKEDELVRVVSINGEYQQNDVIGKIGQVTWTHKNQILVNAGGENPIYVEVGDVEPIPKRKKAWVCLGYTIKKLQCYMSAYKDGELSWRTERNTICNDRIVFDNITDALDHQRTVLDNTDILKVER